MRHCASRIESIGTAIGRPVFGRLARGFAALLCLCMLMLAAGAARAQTTPAGTVIRNTATMSFVNFSGQLVSNVQSNTVSAVVLQVAAFTLTNSQTRLGTANGQVVFSHTITNTGNGPDRFDLSVTNPAPGCPGCGYTLASALLAPDVAPADGVADSAPQATLTTPLLAQGQSYTFVLVTQIPGGATAGQFSQAQVGAVGDAPTATAGGFTAAGAQTNLDQANVSASAVINASKVFSVVSGPSPGAGNFTVTITYSNNTALPATNVHILDWIGQASPAGAPALNTSGMLYVAGSARWSGCNAGGGVLTDASDGIEATCTGTPGQTINYQFNQVGGTAGVGNLDALISQVPPHTSGQFTFSVQVIGGLAAGSAQTDNIGRIAFCDNGACAPGTTDQTSDTNPALYLVTPSGGVDLTLTKTVATPASGQFTINMPGSFLLQVKNIGNTATTGTVTVTDTLPGGLQVTAIQAPGWSCSQSGAYTNGNNIGGGVTVTCTTTTAIAAAVGGTPAQAAPIVVSVTPTQVPGVLVIPAAPPSVTLTNTATVQGGGEPPANNANNTGVVQVVVSNGASIQGRVWQDVPVTAGVLPSRVYNPGVDIPLPNWTVQVLDPTSLNVVASTTTSSQAATLGQYSITGLTPGVYFLQFLDPTNNVVNGTPVCANTAAAVNPAATSASGTNYGGSYNPANCQMPTGGAGAETPSQLDPSGRFLRITLQGGDTIIDQDLPLDPSGIVYNATTGQPVAGATVAITALNTTGTPAAGFVPATDLVGGVSSVITGANGVYQFLLTATGQNHCATGCVLLLTVTAPAGYQPFSVSSGLFPPQASTGACAGVALNCLDAATGPGLLDASGAAISVPPIPTSSKYYLRILVNASSKNVINNNFPLVTTGIALGNLLVQKKASVSTAEQGDFVDYTVTVSNTTVVNANPVIVTDRIPAGFKYVAGSARLSVAAATPVKLPDPTGGAGPVLGFNIGAIAASGSSILTYRLKVSLNAPLGDGKNIASAAAPALGSNTASAIVKISGGVFDTKGYIVGTVFLDCNRDRVQGPREPGIPGVRLFMEDGTMVTTDAEGKYSLYNVSPRTHVMKVDDITLPFGSELIALNNRNAGDPSSRFVDVTVGEMARADFAEGSCAPQVLAEVKARREKGETGQAELNRAFGAVLPAQVIAPAAANIGAPSSGVIAATPMSQPSLNGSSAPAAAIPAAAGAAPSAAVPGAPATAGSAVLATPATAASAASVTPAAAGGAVPVAPPAAAGPLAAIPFVTAPAAGPNPVPDSRTEHPAQQASVPGYQPVMASGGAATVNSSNSNLPPKPGDLTSAQLPPVATAPTVAPALEDVLPALDNAFAILDLKDGDTLPIAQVNIRLKGALGTTFVLTVNGVEVPQTRVGKRSTLESKSLQAWEYIGVTLKQGENQIDAKQIDQFGNARGEGHLKLIAPGNLGKIVIEAQESAVADGKSPVLVKIKLSDDKGVPMTARTAITLSTTLGRWDTPDLNPTEPGVQVFIQNGEATFRLTPPTDPGEANLTVIGGNFKALKKVVFLPFLRPLIGAGIIEGAFNLNSLSLKNMVPTQQRDGFEQQIQRFNYQSSDGKSSTDARAAFFLKGKVLGQYLLTASYDSDKDLQQRVFRDINPDEFYPVYGDSSVRGFDAQTSGRLYVRVDKGRSFVLYGDFNTASSVPNRMLSQYSRTLTGAKWHLEDANPGGSGYQANFFASRDTFSQVVTELPANGTSGPFNLGLASGAVINSEKVEVLTRDRFQPGVILSTVLKTRFSDYQIDPYAGTLLFVSPVPTLDANFNPMSIRVTYEMDNGGKPYWIVGVDGQVKLTSKLEVGGMVVKDQNPGAEFNMGGVNASYKITDKTIVVAEAARTNTKSPSDGSTPAAGTVVGGGNAERVELRHSDGPIDARAYWERAGTNFNNPSSTLTRGREEAGGKMTYKLSPQTTIGVDVLQAQDATTGDKRESLQLHADHAFANGIKLEFGLSHVKDQQPGAVDLSGVATSSGAAVANNTSTGYTSLRVKVSAPVPYLPQASVFAQYEQSVQGDERKAASLGGEYKFSQTGRVYARMESINGTSDLAGVSTAQNTNTAVVGIDTALTKDTKAFSEYRAHSSFDGDTSEAAVGLRNTYDLAPGLKLNSSFEQVQPFTRLATATTSSEATAITGALSYTANPLWKGSVRLEMRTSDASDSYLASYGIAYKLSKDWSLLSRGVWSHTEVKGTTPGEQDRKRLQIGAAYRDTDTNRLSMLTRFEHREELDTTASPILKTATDIASLHFNYQPERGLILSGRFATKYVNDQSAGISSTSFGNLVSGRVTYDVTSRWDVGMIASLHTDGGLSNRKIGLGFEVGYMIKENLWLSGGYNFFGFKDKDLVGTDYTDRGIYVRMRYKFDETLLQSKRDSKMSALAEEKLP